MTKNKQVSPNQACDSAHETEKEVFIHQIVPFLKHFERSLVSLK